MNIPFWQVCYLNLKLDTLHSKVKDQKRSNITSKLTVYWEKLLSICFLHVYLLNPNKHTFVFCMFIWINITLWSSGKISSIHDFLLKYLHSFSAHTSNIRYSQWTASKKLFSSTEDRKTESKFANGKSFFLKETPINCPQPFWELVLIKQHYFPFNPKMA